MNSVYTFLKACSWEEFCCIPLLALDVGAEDVIHLEICGVRERAKLHVCLWWDAWWHKRLWTRTQSHLLHLVTFCSCMVLYGSLSQESISLAGRHLPWDVEGKQTIILEIFLILPYFENKVLKMKWQYFCRQVQWAKGNKQVNICLFCTSNLVFWRNLDAQLSPSQVEVSP